MKRIKQKAIDEADKLCTPIDKTADGLTLKEINDYLQLSFFKGVEFAQRWIPVFQFQKVQLVVRIFTLKEWVNCISIPPIQFILRL